ncbi:MAG: hypothetical protein LJD31_04310 [Wolbachia endosymbiont of Menacanthus eurysternus]|nr:hypothetical protein [Wolbachia endosymbiont of Menacanthus eurysternus]
MGFIEGKALHEVLGECLVQQTQREEKESTQPRENIIVPGSSLDEGVTIEGGVPSPQKETAVNNGRFATH